MDGLWKNACMEGRKGKINMKLNKETEHAYFTKTDMEEIQPIITIRPETEAKKWTSVMRSFYIKKVVKSTFIFIAVILAAGLLLYYFDPQKDPFAFRYCAMLGLVAYLFCPILILHGMGNRKGLIKNGKMAYVQVIVKKEKEYITQGMSCDGSINTIYFYPVLGKTATNYKSTWYIPEWLYETCKEGDTIPCWLEAA